MLLTTTLGPIVRINPWELHINDPEFFDHQYTMTPKLNKEPWYYNFLGIPQSGMSSTREINSFHDFMTFNRSACLRDSRMLIASSISAFATPGANLHRVRRGAVSKLFSAFMALQMQPLVESCVYKLIHCLGVCTLWSFLFLLCTFFEVHAPAYVSINTYIIITSRSQPPLFN